MNENYLDLDNENEYYYYTGKHQYMSLFYKMNLLQWQYQEIEKNRIFNINKFMNDFKDYKYY